MSWPLHTAAQEPLLSNSLQIQTFGISVRYPAGWSVAPPQFVNTWELINVPADQQATAAASARIKIRIQTRTDHAEALGELQEIAAEVSSPSTFLAIGGWPGLQRRYTEQRQQPSQGPRFADETVLRITTAVAVQNLVVRLDATLPSDANQDLIAQAEATGRGISFTTTGESGQVGNEIEQLRKTTPKRSSVFTPSGGSSLSPSQGAALFQAGASFEGLPGFAQRLFTGGNGELEIAASPNGQNIVIARQNNFKTSNDGGQTFPFSGNLNLGDGDPSVAYGQSGNFYLAGIRTNCQPVDAAGPFGYSCTGVFRSTNNGQSFGSLTNAVVCPNADPDPSDGITPVPGSCFPDQEHIGADRINPGIGGDQVYSTWRNFDATDQDPAIVCSQDSGANWTAPVDVDSGFIPRIGVGQDGFVYVVYRSGGNIRINKYSSCRNGLTVQPTFPKTIAAVTDVTCPVPGLDRCNDGNNLSSIMVVVDDTNPNHVYVAYAHETGAGNQNILVRDSLDGGVTWPAARVVTLNSAVPGVRFMPWICTTGGEAFVSWYDRRAATPCPSPPCAANNDLTDYFAGSALLDAGGNLVAGAEFKVNEAGTADAQCAAGATPGSAASWACGVRSTGDSESCSVQPQLAGFCKLTPVPNPDTSSNTRCDFAGPDATICPFNPAGIETCQAVGGGCPKYGDYNGNACAAGRVLLAWASATPPPGIPASGGIDIFFTSLLVGNVPQIQVPGDVAFGDTCVGSTKTATLDVCNTGNENLEVSSISSSNAQFAVTTPSSGFPVVISPDFCFPFQVRFTPTSNGLKTTTLTIASNDPAHPSVEVQATGTGTQPDIRVTGSTSFGQVCAGPEAEKTVSVCNVGACNLDVTSVAFSPACADFVIVNNPFPAPVSPDSCLEVTIRFTPTSTGPKSCTLVITSNDPDTPIINKTVTADTPVASIDVPPNQSFLPEVIQSADVCTTLKPFPISNTSGCNLNITNISIGGANAGDFGLSGLPSFPIILEPGHIAGEGDLKTVFAPTVVDRDRLGTLTVTYETDPITHATTQVTRDLCGEGVLTGARVLVRAGGVPLQMVEKIQLQRINANRNKHQLDTNDVARNLALQTVIPGGACAPFQYHREYGTVSNPIQLLPGSYQVTASAIVNGKRESKTVGFDVSTCDFNPTVIVDF